MYKNGHKSSWNAGLLFGVTTLLFVLCTSSPARSAQIPGPTGPAADTPADLRDLWLRFHESELCQGLDAVFLFRPNGIEIWCVVEEERSLDKLREMIQPLRAKYSIAIYPTHPQPEKKPIEEQQNPPPSLWNNEELRAFLADPFSRNRDVPEIAGQSHDRDFFLKQRMIMFADQTLDWDRKLKRYAAELPVLTRLAVSPDFTSETKARAVSICLAHSQAIDRLATRLSDNLTQALPQGAKRSKAKSPAESELAPIEGADQIARSGQGIAARIERFIYPDAHTVGVVDLKEPSLLESLRNLRKMTSAFQHSMAKT